MYTYNKNGKDKFHVVYKNWLSFYQISEKCVLLLIYFIFSCVYFYISSLFFFFFFSSFYGISAKYLTYLPFYLLYICMYVYNLFQAISFDSLTPLRSKATCSREGKGEFRDLGMRTSRRSVKGQLSQLQKHHPYTRLPLYPEKKKKEKETVSIGIAKKVIIKKILKMYFRGCAA